jgi:DNA-binding CsgD family transcriptional regulator
LGAQWLYILAATGHPFRACIFQPTIPVQLFAMSRRNLIDEKDARAMVRLLGEVAANQGDHAAKKRQLMEGLGLLTKADMWVWGMCTSLEPGKQPVHVTVHMGGFEQRQLGKFMSAVEHPDMAALTASFAKELAEKHIHLTRLEQQFDPSGNMRRDAMGVRVRDAELGPMLISYRPLGEGLVSAVCLYRRLDQPFFGAREARIAHIILSEVPWLHLSGWPKVEVTAVPSLSRRQRTVLSLLIRGLSRKEIASSLGISLNTTNDYVKTVFRHFRVHGQTELVSRFLRGDGGDAL